MTRNRTETALNAISTDSVVDCPRLLITRPKSRLARQLASELRARHHARHSAAWDAVWLPSPEVEAQAGLMYAIVENAIAGVYVAEGEAREYLRDDDSVYYTSERIIRGE